MKTQYSLSLQAFRIVAEQQNFTRAAARLGVSTSALSQTIRQLESRLNARLLNRTTRSVSLTEVGKRLYTRISPLLDEIEHVFDEIKQEQSQVGGSLRLTMPYIVWQVLVNPVLPAFLERYPSIQPEIQVSDGLVDIVKSGIDGGFRAEQMLHQDMVAFPVGKPLKSVIAGSPCYLDRYGTPESPHDLYKHRCLCYRYQSSGVLHTWVFQHDHDIVQLNLGGMVLSEEIALVSAAQSGLGLAHLFEEGVRHELDTKQLIPVLSKWSLPEAMFYFYYPSRRYLQPCLRHFIDFIKEIYVN